MKINKIVLRLIGDPKFCSLQDAFAYAIEDNSDQAWGFVANRVDLEIQVALEHARSLRKSSFWKYVLMRTDLEIVDAISCAGTLHTTEAWRIVLGRSDISFSLANVIALGLSEGVIDWTIWQVVMAKPDLTPIRALETCTAVEDHDVWETLLKNEAMSPLLKEYSVKELFYLAAKSNNHIQVFKVLVSRDEITIDELFECLIQSGDNEIYNAVLARDDFQKWLKKQTVDELVERAKKIAYSPFWEVVIERKDFSIKHAMDLLKLSNHMLTSLLLALPLVQNHLVNIKLEDAVSLLFVDNSSLCQLIMRRVDVVQYIKTCKKSYAINLLENSTHLKTRLLVLRRDDISMKEILKCNISSSDYYHIAELPKFVSYFKRIKIDDAMLLVKKVNTYSSYKSLLKRKALSLEKAIAVAKDADNEEVWEALLSRSDAKLYFGIE